MRPPTPTRSGHSFGGVGGSSTGSDGPGTGGTCSSATGGRRGVNPSSHVGGSLSTCAAGACTCGCGCSCSVAAGQRGVTGPGDGATSSGGSVVRPPGVLGLTAVPVSPIVSELISTSVPSMTPLPSAPRSLQGAGGEWACATHDPVSVCVGSEGVMCLSGRCTVCVPCSPSLLGRLCRCQVLAWVVGTLRWRPCESRLWTMRRPTAALVCACWYGWGLPSPTSPSFVMVRAQSVDTRVALHRAPG